MSMPTHDQKVDAICKAVTRLRGTRPTKAEKALFRTGNFNFAELAADLGVSPSVLITTFSHELFKITGNTALPAIPGSPAERMQ